MNTTADYDRWKTEPPEPATPSDGLSLDVAEQLDEINDALDEIERLWRAEDNLADIADVLVEARRTVDELRELIGG